VFIFLIKKIFYGILVLFGVTTVIFFLFNILPGDPARMMLDQREDAKQLKVIKAKYAFDRPVFEQYLLYLNDISPISIHSKKDGAFSSLNKNKYSYIALFSNLNYSIVLKKPYLRDSFIRKDTPVLSIINDTFKNTFILAISSLSIATIIGLLFGILSALYKNTFVDRFILFLSVLGMSIPSFFAAIIIAWIFGFLLTSYTGLSMTGNLFEVDDYGDGVYLKLQNLILPSITLGIRPLSIVVQFCRNSLIEVLSMDYIRTAYAKGLHRKSVIFKHAIRNAFNPLITVISGWLASLFAGSVFVEYVFGWNGIGKEIVDSLKNMDLPVIMGIVLFIALIFVTINILVDIIYTWIDPRIKIK